ncbi:TetR/AcrR family transcriptional regulator [Cohnella terricola]|uniref:TetR/AcrR family transcriptional regulator n=1 Tax=Cohnella terricola TaxID=1289167 RepID=A0A559JKI0_9BACL|nr:TetR/AcrR family transcriptional regulator [Cohnella terricola]TVY00387.1 TetR/AcrR family transcriptional regulator [Cohnella terricola]
MADVRNGENGLNQEALNNLPNWAKLGWGLGKQPTRGPKGELSVPKIVDAAIAIADKDGLAAVSMNKVASSLGFTTMSLYRYISSKDDLLMLMQDAVSAMDIPPEREGVDWREEMREYVRACVEVFRKHPWFGDISITSVPIMPNTLQIIDWVLRPLRRFPLNDYEKVAILLLISSYARTCGIIMRDLDRAIQAGATPESFSGLNYTTALKELVKPDRYPYLYPVVASGSYTGENVEDNTVGDDFDFGLERILDGVEQFLAGKN